MRLWLNVPHLDTKNVHVKSFKQFIIWEAVNDSEKSTGRGVKTLGHSPGSVLVFFSIDNSVNF